MVRDESTLEEDDTVARSSAKEPGGGNVLGVAVMTRSGARLGTVTDAIFEMGRKPVVAGYAIETPEHRRVLLPVPSPVTVSGDRVLVPDATAQYSAGNQGGFGTAVESLRNRLQHGPQEDD